MDDKAKHNVSDFYNNIGWKSKNGVTVDEKLWEDSRRVASEYVSKCRLRVLAHIPPEGEYILDMASGPIQYPEYLKYSKNYKKRYCVDFSVEALKQAEGKIENGVFLNGNFIDLPFNIDYFDCAISVHTIYHIDEKQQEFAVRKLLNITKKRRPVIIVYSHPDAIFSKINKIIRPIMAIIRKRKKIDNYLCGDDTIYFHRFENAWWKQFEDVAEVNMYPWRSLSANISKKFIPDNKIGALLLSLLFWLEDKFPSFFIKYFQYPMIVLIKK